jgi:hypothetical protein
MFEPTHHRWGGGFPLTNKIQGTNDYGLAIQPRTALPLLIREDSDHLNKANKDRSQALNIC